MGPTCLLGPKRKRHLVQAWKFLSYQSWEGAYVSISSDFEVVSLWSHLDWSLNYLMQLFFNFHWFSNECEVIMGDDQNALVVNDTSSSLQIAEGKFWWCFLA
jgi:hypothetical protein